MESLIFTYEGYKNTNIGDYIQSLAAKQFWDSTNIQYYHRDKLNQYSGASAKVIMNGWFTHQPQNWPPSPNISPLFVAFHLNTSAYEKLLSDKSIEYLKKHEPIGCRDENTVAALSKKGVNAYFSSCLTTTLGYKYASSKQRKNIYIVDPVHYVPEMNFKLRKLRLLFEYIPHFKGINRYIRKIKKQNIYDLSFSYKNLNRYAAIIRSYNILRQILSPKDLSDAIILTQYHYDYEYPTNESRFKRAEELIHLYSEAQLVITSRIHCALPCLGLKTPVIFLQNKDDSIEITCRFNGLLELLNVIEFRKNKIIKSPYKLPLDPDKMNNTTRYLSYANKLIERCKAFANKNGKE